MLPPVSASPSTDYTLPPYLQGGGGGSAGAPPQQAAQAILALVAQGQSGAKLAELLGTFDVATNDVLTQLALKFASSEGFKPEQGESLKAFTTRIADAILSMPPLERIAAESKAGLMNVGVSASALAKALQNPTSVEAARLVALIETRLTSPQDAALKTAISQYQQTSGRDAEGTPVRANTEQASRTPAQPVADAPRADARNIASVKNGAEVLRLLQGDTPATPRQAAVPQSTDAAPRIQTNVAISRAEQPVAPMPAKVPFPATKPEVLAAVNIPQEAKGEAIAPRQLAGNLKAAFSALKDNAAALIQSGAAANVPAPTVIAETQRKVLSTLPPLDASRNILDTAENQQAVTAMAQKAASVIAHKQAALFAAPVMQDEAEGDLEKQISRALGEAGRASQAIAVARATSGGEQAQQPAQLPVGVPFAQVPYPLTENEAIKRKEARDEHQDDEEGQEGSDEQQMQGEGGSEEKKQAANRNEEPVDENPFEADEPLGRHASDADRAYHMYQKFGGF